MRRLRRGLGRLAAALLLLGCAGPIRGETLHDFPFSREDPRRIQGNDACGKCHENEHAVWKDTGHAQAFEKLHKRKRATQIARELGFERGVKRDTRCLTCHFTSTLDRKGEREVAVSGVSCESCHGAAEGWIDIHNDYGDHEPGKEPPEHRQRRLERAREGGMRPPDDFYAVASNCFQCHIVPFEELVNTGGHNPGSGSFDFLARLDSIRHNFVESYRADVDPVNAVRPLERKRVMFVVGRALHLEYALRALAQATRDGEAFHRAAARRLSGAIDDAEDLTTLGGLALGRELAEAARRAPTKAGARGAQIQAADRIAGETRRWLASNPDGARLAALDSLVLGQASLADAPEQSAEDPGAEGSPGPSSPGPAASAGGSSGGAAGAGAGAGELLRHLHPRSKHKTIDAQECSGCHKSEARWLRGHAHAETAEPFLDRAADNARIARRYGISPDEMATGKQICMDCHGTVASGREHRAVGDGVSCQSCHGPAGDYLDPHQDGSREDHGYQRPGWSKALTLGMVDLRPADAKARTCGKCHYITVGRLIAAGHPSGKDFDLAARMKSVQHWEARPGAPNAAALTAAWSSERARRGPVPSVASLPDPGSGGGGGGARPDARPKRPKDGQSPARPAARRPASAGGGGGRASAPSCKPKLESWQPPADDARPEEQLAAIQERLRELYQAAGEGDCL